MSSLSAPIFVAGRQHSGNTLLTKILGQHPDLLTMHGEESILEKKRPDTTESPERSFEFLVEGLHKASSFKLSDDRRREIHRGLQKAYQDRGLSEVFRDHYRMGERLLLEKFGRKRRVQKATSYIFYADRILNIYPDARIIYLMRNPFDIAASLRRRGTTGKMFRMLLGWERGARQADELLEQKPDNVLLVRYEELIEAPKRVLRLLQDFLDIDLHEDYLDVALVNPAEDPYRTEGPETGLKKGKVNYFPDVLSDVEIRAVASFVGDDLLDRFYPDRTLKQSGGGATIHWKRLEWMLHGILLLAKDSLRRGWDDPRALLDRVLRRLW